MQEFNWDPEIDTPATIAVIGGGPVGVEAALYARFLGYFVMLFDAAKVGHRVADWNAREMTAAWGEATSSLGLSALQAQGLSGDLPSPDQRVTYREYLEKYLLPVARTDLLYESVQINSPVVSVSRTGCAHDSPKSIERRAEQEFRLLIDAKQRGPYSQLADVVLDCSGLAMRDGMASGGGLATGESSLRANMRSGKVDVLGKRRSVYADKHTLLFGSDAAACANALDFAELTRDTASTRLTWVIPKRIDSTGITFRFPPADQEDLAEQEDLAVQEDLAAQAQALCESGSTSVIPVLAWGIESLQRADQWSVRLQVGEEETLDIRCDEVINCAQPNVDWSFIHNLFVTGFAHDGVATPEPHYYVLGQKSIGTRGRCCFAQGFEQIREAFSLIGGRQDLNLYDIVKPQNA